MSYHENLHVREISRWVESDGDDTLLLDPVYGMPIDSRTPPFFLIENPRLQEGYDHLTKSMGYTLLQLTYTAGESGPEDLTVPGEPDVLEYELWNEGGFGAVAHTVDGVMPRGQTGLMELSVPSQNDYTSRIAYATLMSDTPTLFAGLESDPAGEPAGLAERQLKKMAEVAVAQAADPTDAGGGALAAEIITRHSYQWYRTLSFGEQLKRLREHKWAHESSVIGHIMLLAPVKDLGYMHKFDTFSNPQTSPVPLGVDNYMVVPDSDTEMMHLQTNAMHTGRLTPNHLLVAQEIAGQEPFRAF